MLHGVWPFKTSTFWISDPTCLSSLGGGLFEELSTCRHLILGSSEWGEGAL